MNIDILIQANIPNVAAVNHNGDSDSTGAICGNMMGLIHGYDSIPAHFKEHLELLPVLVEVATDLYTGSARTDDIISWKRKYLEGHRADKPIERIWIPESKSSSPTSTAESSGVRP